jgi:hypothetical protein
METILYTRDNIRFDTILISDVPFGDLYFLRPKSIYYFVLTSSKFANVSNLHYFIFTSKFANVSNLCDWPILTSLESGQEWQNSRSRAGSPPPPPPPPLFPPLSVPAPESRYTGYLRLFPALNIFVCFDISCL